MSSQDNINGKTFNCPANSIYQDYTRSSRIYNNFLARKLRQDNIDLNDPETYKNYLLNNFSVIRAQDNELINSYTCQYK